MTNSAAIASGPQAAREAQAGRVGHAGARSAAVEEGGDFTTALDRVAGGSRNRPDDEPSGVGEQVPIDPDRGKLAIWLDGHAGGLGEDAHLQAQDALGEDSLHAMLGADAGTSLEALVAGAAGTGAQSRLPATPDGSVRLPGELPAPAPGHGGMAPGKLAVLDGWTAPRMPMTTLRQETHLPPAQMPTALDAGLLPPAEPGSDEQGLTDADATGVPAGRKAAAVQPAMHNVAVTAARGASAFGASWPESGQAAPKSQGGEAALPGGDGLARAEQVAPAVRADLPPGAPVSVTMQGLADRIVEEASTLAAPRSADAPAVIQHAGLAPLKVLHIQLQPADLGAVTLRMSLRDQVLQLDLEVGRHDTGQLLQQERETLSALLRSAGYLIDGLEVRIIDQGALAAGGAGSQQGAPAGGGQAGSAGTDAKPHDARSQSERQGGQAYGRERQHEQERAARAPRGGSGLYV